MAYILLKRSASYLKPVDCCTGHPRELQFTCGHYLRQVANLLLKRSANSLKAVDRCINKNH